jgi:hypothetical protein
MCSLFLGVRCGFPSKRNTISLFVQAKFKKNHTLITNPPPQTPFLKHVHDHRSALHLYNTHRSMLIP